MEIILLMGATNYTLEESATDNNVARNAFTKLL